MRHRKHKYRLASDSSHRKALMRSLALALIRYERIVTTVPKAKALRGYVEKLITTAKRGGGSDLASIRKVASVLNDKKGVKKIFAELASRFQDRPGGYTQVLKIGHRKGDAAEMAMIQFVDYFEFHRSEKKEEETKKTDKTVKQAKEGKTKAEAEAETAVREKNQPEALADPSQTDVSEEAEGDTAGKKIS